MKKQIEFEKAYEPVSEVFHKRVEDTLTALGKEKTMKHTKISRIWVLAAAFVLIVGTAFAAGSRLGLMDFLLEDESGILPLNNAQSLIQSGLLVYEHENVIWSVDQAVYDGECVRALIRVAPVNPETHAVFFPFADDLPISVANRNIETEMGEKTPVSVGFPELEPAGDGQNVDIDRTIIQGVYLSETGEYSMYVFCPIQLRDIETAPEKLVLWLYDGNDMHGNTAFTLEKCENKEAVYLNSDTPLADATIKNVSLTQTPFASYLEIDYAYARSGPQMPVNSNTTYYTTPYGAYIHVNADCSGMQNATALTFKETLETDKAYCPICIGTSAQYYATQNGAFLHTDPNCSGMQNALTLTFKEAAAMNKDHLCPVCAGGSLEAIEDTTTGGQIDFSLYDDMIENASFTLFFGGHETEIENGYKKTYIFSAGETFPDEINLYLIKKGEFTGDSLNLTRLK